MIGNQFHKLQGESIPGLPSRIPELDGFRGIAVMMVLLYHLFTYSMFQGHWTGLASLAISLTKNGWQGVDLFFVLSGFLITGILLDSRHDQKYFRNFYARRALRILPLYYVILLVIFLFFSHSGPYVGLSLCFLSNFGLVFHVPMLNGAMWSLSVEEHFYLIWPLIVRKARLGTVAFLAVAICVLEPIVRFLSLPSAGSSNIYVLSPFRLDGLAMGGLIACLARSSWYSRKNVGIVAVSLLVSGVVLRIAGTPYGILSHDTRFGAALQFVPANMIFAASVLYAVADSGSKQTAILRNGLLKITADLSYCLYLTHCLVMDAYDRALKLFGLPATSEHFERIAIRGAVVLMACFLIAALSRKVLEGPALSFRKYFVPEGGNPRVKAMAAGTQ